jgi:hypothetical protein
MSITAQLQNNNLFRRSKINTIFVPNFSIFLNFILKHFFIIVIITRSYMDLYIFNYSFPTE